jgi:hypothetical protein
MKKVLEFGFYSMMYVWGLIQFKLTRKTPKKSYYALRYFFVKTNGGMNNFLGRLSGLLHPKYKKVSKNGLLGTLEAKDYTHIVSGIREKGYHIFEQSLPQNVVEKLVHYARTTPVPYVNVDIMHPDENSYKTEKVLFDENNIISPRYQFLMQDVFNCDEIQKIVFDTQLMYLAQEYLGCKPVLDSMVMWWSAPYKDGEGASAAAQMYHFDMDRLKFLKFFFYLTDVTPETGPHCYVEGSHTHKPKSVLKDGRHTDEAIRAAYPKGAELEICGKKGSILAVDTSGFHKGKILTADFRLLFQIEYVNSLFGTTYPILKMPENMDKGLSETWKKYKYTYGQIIKD